MTYNTKPVREKREREFKKPGPKPLEIHERDVEKHFTAQVKAAGGEIRKLKWIGRRGAPDRVAMISGRVWWIEFKAPGKKPEQQQLSEHRRMRKAGMTVLVIDHFVPVVAFEQWLNDL